MQSTPKGERVHIAIFGRRNVGKSSLINVLTGQEVSIVSEVKGTTTDPVGKAMELPPLGPVLLTDTPGLDDEGALGAKRVRRAFDALKSADVAIFVAEATGHTLAADECEALAAIRAQNIPLLLVFNKVDQARPAPELLAQVARQAGGGVFQVSATTQEGIEELKLALARIMPEDGESRRLVADLLRPGDQVALVTPIDAAAPKGRLILPQQQTIRDILEAGATALITQDDGLAAALAALKSPPRLVITDSQVFARVAGIVPRNVPLTSFSILFARYKGDLAALAQGARASDSLKDGDRVLIAESCTHHRQSDDIGTVKIPRWLRRHSGRELIFEHSSGIRYPRDLAQYALVVHCGGCMLNRREMHYRIHQAQDAGVPVVNYGILIAHLTGILERCLEALPPRCKIC